MNGDEIITNLRQQMKEQGLFHDETEQYVDEIRNGSNAMLVVVRVRPLTPRQLTINPNPTIQVLDSKLLLLLDPPTQENNKGRSRQAQFSFDFVYDHSASTKQLYDQSLAPLLDGVLEGFNSTILAYGATGCGKTYTMVGEYGKEGVGIGKEGISALAMIDLLGRASEQRRFRNVLIRVSYIEIYNENIKDLLISQDRNLDLREDPKEGMVIPSVTQVTVNSLLELATLLKVGAANRSKEATSANDSSSRSHSLLMVKTQSRDKAQGVKEQTSIGRLTLVDLAGSERSGGKGARQVQGAKINRSLLALGNCIQVLCEAGSKSVFVPYRQSKLTRLLKESLGGNCRTALVVNISPFSSNWEDSHNSLSYANRAKNIKNSPYRNVLATQAHLSSYAALIANLKRQNDQLKKQLTNPNNSHSLPQLRTAHALDGGNDKIEMLRGQHRIDGHFEEERKLLEVINQLTIKLDKAGFRLCKLGLEGKGKGEKGKQKGREKGIGKEEGKARKIVEELSQQKSGFEGRLEELVLERGVVMSEIKGGEFGSGNVGMLVGQYRERKVEVELQQIRLRQERMEKEREEKQQLMGLLGEELRVRDKIIQQQKLIIQKNNIINRITYTRLTQPQPQPFPSLLLTLSQPQPSLLPKQKTPILFQQKSSNKLKSFQGKHSISKRKKQTKQHSKDNYIFQTQQDSLAEKLRSQKEVVKPEKKQSPTVKASISSNEQNKISRQRSKKKNAQLDFIYMQR